MFASIPVLTAARRRFLHKEPAELAEWAIAALVRAGAARIDGGMLVNADLSAQIPARSFFFGS